MKNDCIDAYFYLLTTIKHMKNMNNEKFEKLNNEQKELVKYWIDKYENHSNITKEDFTEKYLTPEPVVEVGKAYKYPDVDGWMLFVSKIDSDGFVYGYGFDTNCLWMDQWEQKHKRELENVVECTEQFKERSIEEAKRRGFKKGVRIKKLMEWNTGNKGKISTELISDNFIFRINKEGVCRLFSDNLLIMVNGKWADIIDEKAEIRESVTKLEAELKELKSKL